jgi:hypothetical protein
MPEFIAPQPEIFLKRRLFPGGIQPSGFGGNVEQGR